MKTDPSQPTVTSDSGNAAGEALPTRRIGAEFRTLPKVAWGTLTGVASFNAVSAAGGAIAIFLTDGLGMPRSFLTGSPFESFLVPGLILLVVVGGSQAIAAVLLFMRRALSLFWAASAGLTMMTWILVETAIIRGFGVLQAVYYLTGAAELLLVLALLGIVGWMPPSRLAVRPVRPVPPLPPVRPMPPLSAHRGGLKNRVVLWAMGSVLAPMLGSLSAVRYATASGVVVLPVQLARDVQGGDIAVAGAGGKRWWRHFRSPASAEILVQGTWRPVTLRALTGDGADAASRRYLARFPSARHALVPGESGLGDARMLRFDERLEIPPRTARSLRRAWIATVASAELLGFIAPVVVGVLTAAAPWPVALSLMMAAGGLEGAMLGLGQAVVLRRALPGVRTGRWVALTSVAAVLAYAIGMAPSSWAQPFVELPVSAQAILGALAGTALLASIGTAQWWELRRHVRHAWPWILWTALAWLLALASFFVVATPLWRPGQPVAVIVAIGVAAGAIMATVQAAVTALGMARILDRQPRSDAEH